MFKFKNCVLGPAIIAGVVMFGSSVYAATVSCPGTAATTDREFTLTTAVAATCLAFGAGNIDGNGDAINSLGYLTVDKSDNTTAYVGIDGEITSLTGVSGLSGHFTITDPAGYKNFVFALKSGEGRLDPDWVAFLLAPGTTSGDWAITVGSQTLSHANLYAQACGDAGCPANEIGHTPIPGALWLFGTVIAGGTGFGRWRKKRNIRSLAA